MGLPAKDEGWISRFIREANEHFKAHQGGTVVTLLCMVAAWAVSYWKLEVPAWTTTVWFLLLLLMLATLSAWVSATKNARALEDNRRPKIATACGPGHDGSLGPNIHNDSLRIVVTCTSIEGVTCSACLFEISRDGERRFYGNSPRLTFCPPNHDGDVLKATMSYGETRAIDVVYVHDDGTVKPGVPLTDWGVDREWSYGPEMEFKNVVDSPGNYFFKVRITAPGMVPEIVNLRFNWTGNRKTSTLEKIADSKGAKTIQREHKKESQTRASRADAQGTS